MQENNLFESLSIIIQKIKRNLIWILPLSIVCAIPFAVKEKAKKIQHEASSKIFPLSAASSSSPMNDIKAQFGISDGADPSKIYNISELLSSKTISHAIVSQPVKGKYKKLAYWILEDENLSIPFWKKKIEIAKMDSMDAIYTASSLLSYRTNVSTSKSDFTTIKTLAYTPELSIELNKAILKELSSFYIKTKTEKAREDLYKLSRLKDSVGRNVSMVENAIAGNADATRYVSGLSAGLPQLKLQRMQEEYLEQYKSVTMAQQNAKFKLLSESPIFQILDQPIKPLNVIYNSWKKVFVLTIIASFFLLSLLAVRKNLWQLVLSELKKS